MKYFLHDSNSFNDEKITELFINFGYEGLGLFYTILEKLASQEKPIKTSVLKSQLKVGKKLEKCWKFMESLEIISSNNGDTFNERLINYAGKYAIKKEKTKERISQWRDKQKDTENVTRYEQPCNADKVKLSKVKESKVNIDARQPEKIEKSIYKSFAHLKINEEEFQKLIEFGYSKNQIDDILETIENYTKNKNYKNLFLTAKKWLSKDPKNNNQPQLDFTKLNFKI